eukprot:193480-Pyramimonas_sp.AAC.1
MDASWVHSTRGEERGAHRLGGSGGDAGRGRGGAELDELVAVQVAAREELLHEGGRCPRPQCQAVTRVIHQSTVAQVHFKVPHVLRKNAKP